MLDALAVQSLPATEILVVDDGSLDGSAGAVDEWKAAHPQVQVMLVQQPNQGPAAARNQGGTIGTGELIVFMDSDCTPKTDWLEKMVLPFQDPAVVGAQGAYQCDQPEWIARFSQLEIEERYARMTREDGIDFIGTYAAAYRREVFNEQGRFDTRFTMASGEDADFSFRLADQGLRMVFQPDAVVYHKHPETVSRYLKQKYWRAYWRNLIYRRHPAKMWKDSYTPTTLKFQTVLGLLFPFSLFGLVAGGSWSLLPLAVLGAIFVCSLPFTLWVFKKDAGIGMRTPFLLFLRTFALSAGTAHGFVRGLWVRGDLR